MEDATRAKVLSTELSGFNALPKKKVKQGNVKNGYNSRAPPRKDSKMILPDASFKQGAKRSSSKSS